MGKIITIKINKGGIGKTFITAQLAAGIALANKKTLILTSDSQNNIFNFLFKGDKKFKKGLKSEVMKGDGEYFRLRDNLYFLPLEDSIFSTQFLKKLPLFLDKIKTEYDYILIDSTPVLKLDNVFLDKSDHIIIPSYADEVTLEGILNLIDEIDINKVLAIVTNRYQIMKVQDKYYNLIKQNVKNVKITEPIPQLSFIATMLDSRKTIWDYSNKEAVKVQEIFFELIELL